jgi:hypothetical protein
MTLSRVVCELSYVPPPGPRPCRDCGEPTDPAELLSGACAPCAEAEWRGEPDGEVMRLRATLAGVAGRVAAQSELLSRRAER